MKKCEECGGSVFIVAEAAIHHVVANGDGSPKEPGNIGGFETLDSDHIHYFPPYYLCDECGHYYENWENIPDAD